MNRRHQDSWPQMSPQVVTLAGPRMEVRSAHACCPKGKLKTNPHWS